MLFVAYDVLVNIVKLNIAIGTNIKPLFNNTFLFFNSIIIPPFFLEQLINYSISTEYLSNFKNKKDARSGFFLAL